MRAGDLTSEHIGKPLTVEADYGPGGRIAATGELIEASHGLTMHLFDDDDEPAATLGTTLIRLLFSNSHSAEITVQSDDEVRPG